MATNSEDLEAWKECREIRKPIFILVRKLPADEKYRLSDQLTRASRSTTANIAEGHGRFHYQENTQFCRHSRGSITSLIVHP
jgi:four helix bundle protein